MTKSPSNYYCNWRSPIVQKLHDFIRWPPSFRHSPLDILLRHLDRTALAMHTVLCVDIQLEFTSLLVLIVLVPAYTTIHVALSTIQNTTPY